VVAIRVFNVTISFRFRKIDTKYYDAVVKFEVVPAHLLDEDNLDALGKKEAFVYYFTEEGELDETFENHISTLQDTYSPEIALMFYNGAKKGQFKKEAEQVIDNVIQNYFIEYLREDLSKIDPMGAARGAGRAGSLLSGDEKVGVERLIESLECCMWSSMLKKKVVPQPQPQISAATTTTVKSNLLVTHTTNPAAPKQNQEDKPSSEEAKDLLEIPLYDPEALSNNLISEPEQL
jgi:hypothetical protein